MSKDAEVEKLESRVDALENCVKELLLALYLVAYNKATVSKSGYCAIEHRVKDLGITL